MAFSDDFLRLTRCPVTLTSLVTAESALLERVNRAIVAGTLTNGLGHLPVETVHEGLVNQSGTLLYPVINGIPCLIAEEALLLEELDTGGPDA